MTQRLQKGDTIGIAAPASPFNKEWFQKGTDLLKKMGFEIHYREDIFSEERYLAGSDERRAEELIELFANPKIKAIFFARGGYGSQRVIPYLDMKRIRKNPKPTIGFSDLTALLTFLRQEGEIPTLYGPVMTQLGNKASERTKESLYWHLTQKKPLEPIPLEASQILKGGKTRGNLVGGCLSLITSSMGTSYELNTKNSILFFEDAGEKVYALDRMLTQLKNAGKFKNVKGIIIGTLEPKREEPHSMKAMLGKIFEDFSGPIITHFPAGHTEDFVSLPLGTSVTIDTKKQQLVFEKPWLS